MVMMASASNNDTQNCSGLSLSNVEQKKQYHKYMDELSQLDNDSIDNKQRVNSTRQVVQEVKNLANSSIANTSVVLLDSYVLRQAGQQALMAVAGIEVNSNVYNAAELAQHVLENPTWWQFALPRRVPGAAALHGAFLLQPPPPRPPRAPRRRADPQRQAAAPRVPANIASLEKPHEDTAMVTRVRSWVKHACRRGPLSYWHAVLDPACFARTVHNVYYVSFLVRDGLLDVYIDETHGIPMVRPVARVHRPDPVASKAEQFVVSLDMARWRTLVESCGITEAMMKLE